MIRTNLILAAVLTVAGLVSFDGPASARSLAIGRCQDRTGTRLCKRATAALRKALRARGVRVRNWRRGVSKARAAGFSGVVRTRARRKGKRFVLRIALIGTDGKLKLRRRFLLRRPRLPKRAARRLAARMLERLTPPREHARDVSLPVVASRPPAPPAPAPASAPQTVQTSATLQVTTAADEAVEAGPPQSSVSYYLEPGFTSFASSNLFLDGSGEWDVGMRPSLGLGLDFGKYWSVGYRGELNTYRRHDDLLSHWHQVSLLANPAWGGGPDGGGTEVLVRIAVETLRNQEAFSAINHVQSRVETQVMWSPARWFRWRLSSSVAYRLFYEDRPSDSLDAWATTSFAFVLPSRTTITPRARYGFRYLPNSVTSATSDYHDHQIEVGVHVSQGLWKKAGLQLDYAWVTTLDDSGLFERKLTQQQFIYLGLDFCSRGHRAEVRFKQLLWQGASLGAAVTYQERAFAGWPALGEDFQALDHDRHDHRLMPRAFLSYAWWPGEGTSRIVPAFGIQLEYTYVRQWSNSAWFDAGAHIGGVGVWGSW